MTLPVGNYPTWSSDYRLGFPDVYDRPYFRLPSLQYRHSYSKCSHCLTHPYACSCWSSLFFCRNIDWSIQNAMHNATIMAKSRFFIGLPSFLVTDHITISWICHQISIHLILFPAWACQDDDVKKYWTSRWSIGRLRIACLSTEKRYAAILYTTFIHIYLLSEALIWNDLYSERKRPSFQKIQRVYSASTWYCSCGRSAHRRSRR